MRCSSVLRRFQIVTSPHASSHNKLCHGKLFVFLVGADFLNNQENRDGSEDESSSDPSLFSWLFTDDDLKEKSDSAGLKDGVKLTSVILSPDGRWAEGLLNPAEVSTSREFSVDDS